jgi:hypothetical protein
MGLPAGQPFLHCAKISKNFFAFPLDRTLCLAYNEHSSF